MNLLILVIQALVTYDQKYKSQITFDCIFVFQLVEIVKNGNFIEKEVLKIVFWNVWFTKFVFILNDITK